ncbi:MAG: hypothetical protein N2039_06310 [Gemmataceae bacterium]|nr:hypothetical protein [Gemmataceae bacterium]
MSTLTDLAKTANARKRIRELAAGQKTEPKFPAYLQRIRAVELLERLSTIEARELLAEIANGYPEAALTKDAAQALRRVKRPAPNP